MRKLFLSLFVLVASAGYVAKTVMTDEGGVEAFLDRISFRPAPPPTPTYDPFGLFSGYMGDPCGSTADAEMPPEDRLFGGPVAAAGSPDPASDTPLYGIGQPVPNATPADEAPTPPPKACSGAPSTGPTAILAAPSPELPAATVADAPTVDYRDGVYTGSIADAYFGPMQVRANVSGGRVVSVDVLKYPFDRSTSRLINGYALPLLQREVVQGQVTDVDIISGATLTAIAYFQSLRAALKKAQ